MRRETTRRLRKLLSDLARDGYDARVADDGSGVYYRLPDRPLPEVCAMMRLNLARAEDAELDRAWLPFLKRETGWH